VRTKVTAPTVDPTACLLATQKADPPTDNKIAVDCNAIHLARMATKIKQNLYMFTAYLLRNQFHVSRFTNEHSTRFQCLWIQRTSAEWNSIYEHCWNIYWECTDEQVLSTLQFITYCWAFRVCTLNLSWTAEPIALPRLLLSRVAILKQNSKHEREI
jgi:hypothetical protein